MTTAKGGEFAIVLPVTDEGGLNRVLDAHADPLPTATGANRGRGATLLNEGDNRNFIKVCAPAGIRLERTTWKY